MNKEPSGLKKIHTNEGLQKISQLENKIDTTKYNIEVSSEERSR